MSPLLQTIFDIGLSNAAVAIGLALLATIVTYFCRRPAVVHLAWLLVLVKLISPAFVGIPLLPHRQLEVATTVIETQPLLLPATDFLVPIAATDLPLPRPMTSLPIDFTVPAQTTAAKEPTNSWSFATLLPWLYTAWAVGSAAWFVLLIVRVRTMRRLLARAGAAPQEISAEVATLSKEMSLSRQPRVVVVDAKVPPFVWLVATRPTMVLPRALWNQLDTDQRRMLLAHELAHLVRRDHWVCLLEMLVLGLFWWFPVAWYARRQIGIAAEACCDATVVRRFPELGRVYASTLMKAVEFVASVRPARPVLGVPLGEARLLRRRFEMILRGYNRDRLPKLSLMLFAIVALLVLPISLATLRAEEQKNATTPTKQTTSTIELIAQADAKPPKDDVDARLRRVEELLLEMKEERAHGPGDVTFIPRGARPFNIPVPAPGKGAVFFYKKIAPAPRAATESDGAGSGKPGTAPIPTVEPAPRPFAVPVPSPENGDVFFDKRVAPPGAATDSDGATSDRKAIAGIPGATPLGAVAGVPEPFTIPLPPPRDVIYFRSAGTLPDETAVASTARYPKETSAEEKRVQDRLNDVDKMLGVMMTLEARAEAAGLQFAADHEQYRKGNVSVDLMLDAHRRLFSSEVGLAQSKIDLMSGVSKEELLKNSSIMRECFYRAAKESIEKILKEEEAKLEKMPAKQKQKQLANVEEIKKQYELYAQEETKAKEDAGELPAPTSRP